MADTYVYLIHEGDWDSDAFLGGDTDSAPAGRDPAGPATAGPDLDARFPEHKAFQRAVAEMGARIIGGAPLHHSRHGGTVRPGAVDRAVEDAVYTDGPFPDTSEVITGFYMVETDDEDTARRVAALVPTGGHVEWRKVFPTGM
ncbi:YciI family protein [Terrabacter sp. NPDC000476]|uniref:YciI family protein n=1 Tax=Terrabacter sp. NPDC000476 TaxID=3154258 RepID=UPI0033247D26